MVNVRVTIARHLVGMAIPVRDLLDRLDESAAMLEDLLDRHPGRHLLAEYETTVLEQSDASPGHLSDLLARVEQAILSLCPEQATGASACPRYTTASAYRPS